MNKLWHALTAFTLLGPGCSSAASTNGQPGMPVAAAGQGGSSGGRAGSAGGVPYTSEAGASGTGVSGQGGHAMNSGGATANGGAPASGGAAGVGGSAGTAGQAGASGAGHSLFQVSGSQILKNGVPFVVKGVNISGYRDDWPGDSTDPAMVHALVDCWGFNTVRVRNYPLGAVHYSFNDSLDYLDRIVTAYTSKGLVVLLDAHDRIGSFYTGTDLEQLVTWHKALATKYANNPYVWLDISNEPGENSNAPPDVTAWTTMFQAVIAAVRNDAASDKILFVEATSWGQDAANWNADDVDPSYSVLLSNNTSKILNFSGQSYANIVFSIHVYDQWMYGDTRMSDYFSAIKAKQLAMVVGEWGTWNNVNTPEAMRSFGRVVLPSNDVGRIVWAWGGLDGDTLTSDGSGAAIDDCAKPTNLTELGSLVWGDTHR